MMRHTDPFGTNANRVMVFGHPGHELALFGLVQRHRAPIVVLTDGGGEHRVAESRAGLTKAGQLDRVTYLGFRESSFYEALLGHDRSVFAVVADALRDTLGPHPPEQVFCDAVEFYNPIHDITLPIVLRAVRDWPQTRVFEVPLVYQTLDEGEQYNVQRFPSSRAAARWQYALTDEEVALKEHARDQIYLSLRKQLGPEFLKVPRDHLAQEEVGEAASPLEPPHDTGRALRYEWRARLLRNQGAIENVITYTDHWRPMAAMLTSQL